jgi:hypothetical protein
VAVLAAVGTIPVAGCGSADSQRTERAGSWREAPAPPLSAREWAVGVWTGREALVIGGNDGPVYAPNYDGPTVETPPRRDGAAFNPRTRSWRPIADAPIGIENSSGVAVGGSVYIGVPADPERPTVSPTRLLAYRIDRDRWDSPPPPPKRAYSLVVADDRLIAFGGRPRTGPPGYVLRRDGRSWRPLPADPLPRKPPRGLYWNGLNRPLARAATLELGARRWRRLPDSHSVLYGRLFWVRVGHRLVSPWLGDGSPRYHWGRPLGGILDPERGIWSDLPDPPERSKYEFGTGVVTRTRGHYAFPHGLVLDTTRNRWILLPALPTGWGFEIGGATVVSMGRNLLAFGGPRFPRGSEGGRLVNDAWVWSPPPPAE